MGRTRHSRLGLLLVLAAACSEPERPGTPPRHALLITVSALRADHLSCYLYARPTSAWPASELERRGGRALAPDDLAAQGVLFVDAFSSADAAVPALQSLFAGSDLGRGPLPAEPLAPNIPLVVERFLHAGFRTAAFVSGAQLAPIAGSTPRHGLQRGFETWDWRARDADTLARARAWLAERATAGTLHEPLFLWLHLSGSEPPHDPGLGVGAPGDDPAALDFERTFTDPSYAGPADGSLAFLQRVEAGDVQLTAADREHLVDLYDGSVAELAAGVRGFALFLRELDEGAFWEQTALAFAGTHGVELGEHGGSWSARGSPYAAVLRVPLFLRHPASLTGARVLAEPVELCDVGVTLLEWLAVPALHGGPRPGRSLLRLTDSYVERDFPSRAPAARLPEAAVIRTRRWTLVARGAPEERRVELYDRHVDPSERVDVSAGNPDVVRDLAARLDAELARGVGPAHLDG